MDKYNIHAKRIKEWIKPTPGNMFEQEEGCIIEALWVNLKEVLIGANEIWKLQILDREIIFKNMFI